MSELNSTPPPYPYQAGPSIDNRCGPSGGDDNHWQRVGGLRAEGATRHTPAQDQALPRLQPFYYSLYAGSCFVPSIRPENPPYLAISAFYLQHVPPPRTAQHVIRHICSRENIQFCQKMKLYTRAEAVAYPCPRKWTTFNGTGEIPMSWRVDRGLPIAFGPNTRIGTEDNPLRLLLSCKDDETGQFGVEKRRAAGLSFTGSVDAAEVSLKVQRNVQTVPASAVSNNINNQAPATIHPVHYRLFWVSGGCVPLPSIKPLIVMDPSLSSTETVHVPPPGNGKNFIDHIAALEGFHPSRLKLYERDCAEIFLNNQVRLLPNGGRPADDPLLVTVDLPAGADREPDRGLGLEDINSQPILRFCVSSGLCMLTYVLASLIITKDTIGSIVYLWLAAKLGIIFYSSRRKTPFLMTMRDVLLADIVSAIGIYCELSNSQQCLKG